MYMHMDGGAAPVNLAARGEKEKENVPFTFTFTFTIWQMKLSTKPAPELPRSLFVPQPLAVEVAEGARLFQHEGDAAFSSAEKKAARAALRFDPRVLDALTMFWQLAANPVPPPHSHHGAPLLGGAARPAALGQQAELTQAVAAEGSTE